MNAVRSLPQSSGLVDEVHAALNLVCKAAGYQTWWVQRGNLFFERPSDPGYTTVLLVDGAKLRAAPVQEDGETPRLNVLLQEIKPHEGDPLWEDTFRLIALAKSLEVEGRNMRRLLYASPAPETAGWIKCSEEHPAPHGKYQVRRDGLIYTATPCYGMHSPWWVVKTMHGEAVPTEILDSDEWRTAAPSGEGEDYKALYYELIMEVANKYPGETRHETARRIIRQRESGQGHDADAAKSLPSGEVK